MTLRYWVVFTGNYSPPFYFCLFRSHPFLVWAIISFHSACRTKHNGYLVVSPGRFNIFLGNHRSQLPDIRHRASVWRTVSCNAFLNLRLVRFLFDATLNIVCIGKIAHKKISVTFFSGTTEASFLIFGTEHQYGELYGVMQF